MWMEPLFTRRGSTTRVTHQRHLADPCAAASFFRGRGQRSASCVMSNPRVSTHFAFGFSGRALTLQRPLVPAPKVGVLQSLGQSRRSPELVDAPAADPPPAFGWAARAKVAWKTRRITQIGPHWRGREVARPPASCCIRPLHANNCHAPKPVAEHANLWANLRFPIGLELLKQETRPKTHPFPRGFSKGERQDPP